MNEKERYEMYNRLYESTPITFSKWSSLTEINGIGKLVPLLNMAAFPKSTTEVSVDEFIELTDIVWDDADLPNLHTLSLQLTSIASLTIPSDIHLEKLFLNCAELEHLDLGGSKDSLVDLIITDHHDVTSHLEEGMGNLRRFNLTLTDWTSLPPMPALEYLSITTTGQSVDIAMNEDYHSLHSLTINGDILTLDLGGLFLESLSIHSTHRDFELKDNVYPVALLLKTENVRDITITGALSSRLKKLFIDAIGDTEIILMRSSTLLTELNMRTTGRYSLITPPDVPNLTSLTLAGKRMIIKDIPNGLQIARVAGKSLRCCNPNKLLTVPTLRVVMD